MWRELSPPLSHTISSFIIRDSVLSVCHQMVPFKIWISLGKLTLIVSHQSSCELALIQCKCDQRHKIRWERIRMGWEELWHWGKSSNCISILPFSSLTLIEYYSNYHYSLKELIKCKSLFLRNSFKIINKYLLYVSSMPHLLLSTSHKLFYSLLKATPFAWWENETQRNCITFWRSCTSCKVLTSKLYLFLGYWGTIG